MRIPIVCTCLLLIQVYTICAQTPLRYSAVIHEIMCKPSPVAGLPPFEYVELRNISDTAIQLKDWWLAVNKRETRLPAYWLQPDSMLVLCSPAAVNSFSIANIAGVDRMPALADDSGLVVLYNRHKQVVHAVAYDDSWYGNTRLAKGGYSLEMGNAALPCSGKINWQASSASAGGTPGKYNATAAPVQDESRPDLLYAGITDSLHITLQFSKTLDSALAGNVGRYQLTGDIRILSATVLPPLFNAVSLQLSQPLQQQLLYTVTVNGIADCAGAVSGWMTTATLGRPQAPVAADVIINELLFYPLPGRPEFIELYNRSTKVIALDSLRICARKAAGRLEPLKRISAGARLLMPGQWLAITTDATLLCRYYHCRARGQVEEVGSLPVMPMAAGQVVLLTADSLILDEVHYTDKQHFQLGNSWQGASLERIDAEAPSLAAGNWHTAAATAGYATPGAINSQQRADEAIAATTVLTPEVFSPDADGIADQTVLSFRLPGPGWVGNVTVYDAKGVPVRFLARNILLGNTAFLPWDGTGENAVVLPSGIYIFFIEIFNRQGEVRRWKHTVVVARKLS
ncbi:lamin tail domain-containing protein [Chitinophaga nivalis]|uniref:Lamin tail domain-containing protein n=1 Tax=Chitinophaga nivalis TaxID=2991709 RepID=A0ABT3IUM5_9BACT|nr:lamin tail domain-containing protein [Chitinophaga nivalis]MCW3462631.1 lamin tail domain-containing protein [Chitinophaga nivalis]MCW3487678.1 lamin tail domain-containing protein [Chitinophaga nivalis]